jgi:hypothetical protein
VKVYRKEAKLSAQILSGWPLIEEAETVSRLLSHDSARSSDPLPEEASARPLTSEPQSVRSHEVYFVYTIVI